MTATDALSSASAAGDRRLPLMLSIAARELRAGLSGFRIFIACVALGVMVITGVGAVSDALRAGFEAQGEAILGGDLTLARTHVRADEEERAVINALGRVSESATMRTMARRPDNSDQALAELKAVDDRYPLVGKVEIASGMALQDALREGAVVDQGLLERLKLKVGDSIGIGGTGVKVAGALKSEPDGLTDRLTYGPRVLISQATLDKTGLIKPGTLVRWRYAVKHGDTAASEDELVALREKISGELPESGFTIADKRDPSPQVTRTLERLRQFLTLVGLTSLLVGGVGIANAVATFIDKRRKVIATMKSIGATSRMVLGIFLLEVLAVAMVGVVIGLALGVLAPYVLDALFGDVLPIAAEMTVTPLSIVTALIYGFGVALLFALWPLGRVERVSASMLFRDEVSSEQALPRAWVIVATIGIGIALFGFAMLTSDSKLIAVYFSLGLIVVFAVFHVLGVAVTWLARRVPRPRIPELSLAIGNLGAPGGLTRSVVLSLGAGLSLLVAVALADASLVRELKDRLPTSSPDYFVLDVPKEELDAMRSMIEAKVPGSVLEDAPMLRGRLVRLNDVP
ncbi:MAG: ABC transporter permease, partial [Hyphomicrobium sp.]